MNDNDLRKSSFEDDYKRLMAAAYPGPKTDIRAAVMAQIAKETEQSAQTAKILTRKRRNLFVKYGSMAACVVLLAALGFRVLPMMMNDAVVETAATTEAAADACALVVYDEDGAVPETAAEPEAAAGNSSAYFKTNTNTGEPIEEYAAEAPAAMSESYSDTTVTGGVPVTTAAAEAENAKEEIVEEEPAEEAAAAVPEPVTEEASDDKLILPEAGEILMSTPASSNEAIPETVVEEAVVEEAPAEEMIVEESAPLMSVLTDSTVYGGTYSAAATVPKTLSYTAEGCLHDGVFRNSFHDIPQSVVLLAADSVTDWWTETAGSCNMNIYELLTVCSIPRESFETLYATSDLWYHHDYNVDLLYSGDRAAVYEYYLNGGNYAQMVKRYFEYELKLDLYAEVGSKAYSAWASARSYNAFCKWSLAEFVDEFGITRERFTELYDALTAEFAQSYPGCDVVVYDLDTLYGMGPDITDSIARGDMGYVTDALYHQD